MEDQLLAARATLADNPEAAFEVAQAIAESSEGRPTIEALRIQGQARLLQGRHAEALSLAEEAAALAGQLGDALLAAQVQIAKIDALGWLNRADEAFALGARLSRELTGLGATVDAGKVLTNVGILHYRRDEYTAALARYDEAIALFHRPEHQLLKARVQVNQANVLTALHLVDDALTAYESARAIFARENQPIFVATVEINLGHLHYISGHYALALELLERARETFVRIDDEEGVAQCDLDRGDVYRALNLYPESLPCYERAIAAFAAVDAPYDRGRAETGCGATLYALGRADEASAMLVRARRTFRQQGNPLRMAYIDFLWSEAARARGEEAPARRAASRAERAFRRAGLEGLAAEARYRSVEARLEEGRGGVRSMTRIASIAARTHRGWLESRALRSLGRRCLRVGDRERGIEYLRRSVAILEEARTQVLPEEHHTAFLTDKLDAYEDLVVALTESEALAEALSVVERAKSRLLLERLRRNVPPAPQPPESERVAALRAALSASYHRLLEDELEGGARRVGAVGLPELEREYREALVPPAVGFSSDASLDPERLQSRIADDETLVEYYVARGVLSAFVVTRDRIRYVPALTTVDALEWELRRWRFQLQKASMRGAYFERYQTSLLRESREVLQRLHAAVWKPLEGWVTSRRVTVIPHGPLHGLPFHALSDGERYLLDRHEICCALSAGHWQATREREDNDAPSGGSGLLLGVPGANLPHVEAEIRGIQALFPEAQTLLGTEATRAAFLRSVPEASWLHLATHGLFRADNPLFSGLQLADGWLLAGDLHQVRLQARLVTLSACRTAVGLVQPGDEVFGLVRSFLGAGVRAVAASLWPVDDRATAELMEHLYRRLSAVGVAAALREAQIKLRESYPHPYFWAAFELLGNRDEMLSEPR